MLKFRLQQLIIQTFFVLSDIAGLAYGGAACSPYGQIYAGQTWRVGIALDDYAYTGVIATTHEVGHL